MKLLKFLFSGWLMGALLLVFAFVLGKATFVENDYGAVTAKMLIYNTTWFEILLLLMIVNFSGMIFTKQLFIKSKLNILIIHVALIIIIIGAGVTRYFGFEGQMHIRNGQTTNEFRSSDTYLQVRFKKGDQVRDVAEKVFLSPVKSNLLTKSYEWQGSPVEISLVEYIPNAEHVIVKGESGNPYISIVLGNKTGRQQFFLKEGNIRQFHGFGISFGDTTQHELIQIIQKDGDLFMRFPQPMRVNVTDTKHPAFNIEGFVPLDIMSIHTIGETSFIVKEFIEKGKVQYRKPSGNVQSGIPVVKVTVNDQTRFLPKGKEQVFTINGSDVTVKVGFKQLELPFALKLDKFDLERYPGSSSPSSYASDVVLIDTERNIERPYRIYMNHILNYGGYRFFQSSYDQDEMGTILSVNHDYWGTFITYFGYFLLFATLIISFFTPKTRFRRLSKQLADVHEKRKKLVVSVALFLFVSLIGNQIQAQVPDIKPINKEHAANFGKLLVQNKEGRIEPVNTLAINILVKINKKSKFKNMTAEQVFLGILSDQTAWQQIPIIKVGDEVVANLLGINGDFGMFKDFIDENGKYKLGPLVEKSYIKKPAERSNYDKSLINIDERVNVFFMVLNRSILRIFPLEDNPNNKWISPPDFHKLKGHGTQDGDLFENYVKALSDAATTGNYDEANAALDKIRNYQFGIGSEIIPSETKTKLEIVYNKVNIFKNLFPVFMFLGMILIGIFFIQIFKPSFEFQLLIKIFFTILIIAFILQTAGLGVRWYISGHAPWSNGYESMIYISWATMLAGFIFRKKSSIALGVTAMLSGITLLTAHMSWLNPELTDLVPVLKSYWLTIHVATITGSYGFLALGSMIAFLNLCIMIFRTEKNIIRVNLTLKELNLIIEMSLIVGLILLVIGNFLGGIWANESWGRYWGWDPKETWSLITIIIYSFILHMRQIPGFRSTFTFNFLAMIGFGSVLMTYFGVNYYLTGLHSYASGEPVPVPTFVYYSLVAMLLISLLAAYNDIKIKDQDPVEEKIEN